jgi:hypothetical protein
MEKFQLRMGALDSLPQQDPQQVQQNVVTISEEKQIQEPPKKKTTKRGDLKLPRRDTLCELLQAVGKRQVGSDHEGQLLVELRDV